MAERIVSLPEPSLLNELLNYDQVSGNIFWKARPDRMFEGSEYSPQRLAKKWNTRYAGKIAFTAKKQGGYSVGRIFKKSYLAHRVIWAMFYGEWPSKDIDHVNGNTADNRIENLRLATQSQNMMNMKKRSDNNSSVKGVFWSKRSQKWCAQIAINNVSKHLGYYEDINDAAKAYETAASNLFGEFANLG